MKVNKCIIKNGLTGAQYMNILAKLYSEKLHCSDNFQIKDLVYFGEEDGILNREEVIFLRNHFSFCFRKQ